MLDRVIAQYFRLIELVLVLCLGAMVFMVLGNVVLRYGFNSGITASEELSRFLFVWLTFLGAVVGLREGAHLGIDTLLRLMPLAGRRLCFAINHALMLLCCALFFVGTWRQREVNLANEAPVTGLAMEWVYGVAYVSAGSMMVMIAARLWRLLVGRLPDDALIDVADSEEKVAVDAAGTRPLARAAAGTGAHP